MKIIGIAGRKQAGKNTVANCINGSVLLSRDMIKDFYIDTNGKLIVQTSDSTGTLGYGEFDVTRKDMSFVEYAHRELWPYIKIYHFADTLKEIAIGLFGIDHQQVYGSDDDKNKPTHLLWDDIPNSSSDKTGPMTAREFLQYFGTDVVRKIYNNAWVNATLNRVINEQSEIAIIPDVRFPNEVSAIRDNGGIVIRLTRDLYHSDHDSEKALDIEMFDWKNFDIIIDNSNMTIEDLCETLKSNNRIWSA
jgi:hypothetical protein